MKEEMITKGKVPRNSTILVKQVDTKDKVEAIDNH